MQRRNFRIVERRCRQSPRSSEPRYASPVLAVCCGQSHIFVVIAVAPSKANTRPRGGRKPPAAEMRKADAAQRGANGFCQPPRPAGARGGKGGFEIIEHDLLILRRQGRHAMPVGHPLQRILPLPAGHALLGHQLEAVAGGAGIKRVVAAGPGGIVLGILVARRKLRRLREGAAAKTAKGRPREAGRWTDASADQHGDAVHRIAAIALRIPASGDVRLHLALGVGAARPDFEIAVRRLVSTSRSSAASRICSSACRPWRWSRSRRSRSKRRPC